MRKAFIFGVVAFVLAGCDSGPDGPGDLTGSILSPSPAVGAVVFEVVGGGIEGFSGEGGTKVFWAVQENPVVFRVVVIGDGSGGLRFSVSVQEKGGRLPRASVVSAVDTDNQPLFPITEEYQVRFSR